MKQYFKVYSRIVLVVCFGLAGTAANAGGQESQTFSLGTFLNSTPFFNLDDQSQGTGYSSFNDYFTFSTTYRTKVYANLIANEYTASMVITGFNLVNYPTLSIITQGVTGSTVFGSTTFSTAALKDPLLLPAGNYALNIFGTLNPQSNSGGYVGYLSSRMAAPVPEPTEGALLLFGIGLLGFIASRRKNNV